MPYAPSVSLPAQSHPSLSNPPNIYSHSPSYGSGPSSSAIPVSLERGGGGTPSYGYGTFGTKRQRVDSTPGYAGPSPYTIDNSVHTGYLQHQSQHQPSQVSHSPHGQDQSDIFSSLGAAFNRPTTSPSSSTGPGPGRGRQSNMYGTHGSPGPDLATPTSGSNTFVGLLGSGGSASPSGRHSAPGTQQSAFAWPSHGGGPPSGPSPSQQHPRPGTTSSGGGGGGGSDTGWLDFFSSAPAHASGAGAPVSSAAAAYSGTSAPMPEAPHRLGKRTRSESFTGEDIYGDEGHEHGRGRGPLKEEEVSDSGLTTVSGRASSHSVRTAVGSDLEEVFKSGRSDSAMGNPTEIVSFLRTPLNSLSCVSERVANRMPAHIVDPTAIANTPRREVVVPVM
jgi:hypothetical protein